LSDNGFLNFRVLRYFDKYYKILHLTSGAGDADIKKAYRKLAKKYHPDVSGTEDTRTEFIRVNEAYEILMNRDAMVQEAVKRSKAKSNHTHYKSKPAFSTRERAESHADMSFEEFQKTPLYKTAMVMDSAFDYIFVFAGIFMILAPIFAYITESIEAKNPEEEPEFHFLPIFLGAAFLYGIWYFLFKPKRLKQDQE